MGTAGAGTYRPVTLPDVRDSSGQSSLEWIAVLAVVVLVVGSVAAAAQGTGRAIADQATCLVKAVGGGECGKAGGTTTDPDPPAPGCGEDPSYGDGPPILYANGGSDWVPQGLGYDESDGSLYTTYYSKPGEDPDRSAGVLLSIQDPKTGDEIRNAHLIGPEGGPDHAGGVAINGDNVYVASSDGQVYVYDKGQIAAADGGDVEPVDTFDVPTDPLGTHASAYLTFHDGQLYVGSFHEEAHGHLYSIPIGDDGRPTGDPVDDAIDRGETPVQSQGLAITDDSYLFSTSYGRTEKSHLVAVPRDGGEPHEVEAPNMAEGLVVIDGQLYTLYESGSQAYESDDDDADPRGSISVTPLGSVDPSIC